MGQGQIAGSQQQTEWNAANAMNVANVSNAQVGAAQTADAWQKQQAEDQMAIARGQAASNAQPMLAGVNGNPAMTSPAVAMSTMAAPPAAAVVPNAPAAQPGEPPPFVPELAGAPQQAMATMGAPQAPQVSPAVQQFAAQAAGTAPVQAPSTPAQTPAQKAAATVGVQPATPQERMTATANGKAAPMAAGTTPQMAAFVQQPIDQIRKNVAEATEQLTQRMRDAYRVGDVHTGDALAQQVQSHGTQLIAETRAQAQLQMDQLKTRQYYAGQIGSVMGGATTVADFNERKTALMQSGALDNAGPIGQIIAGANPQTDAEAQQFAQNAAAGSMTAYQNARVQSSQIAQKARDAENLYKNSVMKFDEDLKTEQQKHKEAMDSINNKVGNLKPIPDKSAFPIMDNVLAPAYFGTASVDAEDPDYQIARQGLYEAARSRMQGNRAIGFQQAYQMEVDAASKRGELTPNIVTQTHLTGADTKQQQGSKYVPQGMTSDKPIQLTPDMRPGDLEPGRYYSVPEGPSKGLYFWNGQQRIHVPQ
jgi:hypothetical protein